MRNPICLFRSMWRSLTRLRRWSGHEFRPVDYETPPNIHILRCKTCGKHSVAWDYGSLEDQK